MQFIKYIIAGVINTLIGYGVFFVLLRTGNVSPEYANVAGYGIALLAAFMLNKIFVFDNSIFYRGIILKFAAAFLVSFIINQLVLMFFYHIVGLSAEIAQIFAMASYTLVFYFLNKHFVFTAVSLSSSDNHSSHKA